MCFVFWLGPLRFDMCFVFWLGPLRFDMCFVFCVLVGTPKIFFFGTTHLLR